MTAVQRATPWGDTPPPEPDDVTLAELGLKPKARFSYLFDFGDNWMHELHVESVAPADGGMYPRLVASEGDNPVQYPLPNEEYDEEEGWLDDFGDDDDYPAGPDSLLSSPFGLVPPAGIQTILDAFGIEAPSYNDLSQFGLPVPNPALRPLPIDMNLLVPAFELIPPESLFFDAERGDLLIVPPDDAPESLVLRETLEGAPERYLQVPEATGERQLAAMVAFTDGLADGRLKTRLQASYAHHNGFDRWYRALERDPDAADRWDDETDRRHVADALTWLAEHGITPTPPAEPEPAPALVPETHAVSDARPRPAKKPTKPRPKRRKR